MKRILITGVNSYVGNSLEKWLRQYPDKYSVDKISLRDGSWKEHDFSKYDTLVHCVGMAHQKETKRNAPLYYQVNRDLAYEVAQKSKAEGIHHFIFLSSMSVYGLSEGVIDKNTPLKPKTNYGKSKLEAEQLITSLEGNKFKVAIIRPPMIYGKGCKGNYPRLAKLAIKTPVFPNVKNKRSMIYIENLNGFLKLLIDNVDEGLFFPQNDEYVCTSNLVKLISNKNNKTLYLTKLFNFILKPLKFNVICKVFGNLVYKKDLSIYKNEYSIYDFESTVSLTEKGN